MADDETVNRVPAIAFKGVEDQWDRMVREGIPGKFDRKFLADKAEGTQFGYRQSFRDMGLTTSDDQPTPLLRELVNANEADRRELFAKIMLERWGDLARLSSRDDFFRVLRDRYRVNSEAQQRKTLTFFVHAADYAGLEINPGIRPAKPGTGSRKPTVDMQNSAQPQPAHVASAPMTRDEMRVQYFALLMKNVSEGTRLDPDMLNRLDRLVGLGSTDEKEDRDWKTAGSKPATPPSPASQGEG
jgi:hypothetical protein